jgi:hypothetical protein
MNNSIAVFLRSDRYIISNSWKPDAHKKLAQNNVATNKLKAEILELNQLRKQIVLDLLTPRQQIIYKHSYNHNLTSDDLQQDERYQKRVQALKEYDNKNGTFIEID